MKIALSKSSEVPVRRQIAEQIVLLITTGGVVPGQSMPSVRSLARQLKIHHNTVSEAYQDLVNRNWLNRQRGRRLVVGSSGNPPEANPSSLDELINQTIDRARSMGYSLQELTERVRVRLSAQPADHVLVVEEEEGLREIICREVREGVGDVVHGCSPAEFLGSPSASVGAQIFAPSHTVRAIRAAIPAERPAIAIVYGSAEDAVEAIRQLKRSSVIATVSISESALKAARGLFASAIGRKHTLREMLVREEKVFDLRGADLAFCDSVTMRLVRAPKKILYRLVAPDSLRQLAAAIVVANILKTERRDPSRERHRER